MELNKTMLLEVLASARTKKKFEDSDITPQLRDAAIRYVSLYENNTIPAGDSYLVSMRNKVEYNLTLTAGMVRGILNWMLADPEYSKLDQPNYTKTNKVVEPFVLGSKVEVVETSPAEVTDEMVAEIEAIFDESDTFPVGPLNDDSTELEFVEAEIKNVEQMIADVEAQDLSIFDAEAAAAQAEEDKIMEEMRAKLEEVRKRRQAANQAKAEMKAKTLSLASRIADLEKKKVNLLEIQAAKAKFQAIEDKVNQLIEGQLFADKLYDFQRIDLCFLVASYLNGSHGVLNANDMGLGKTLESTIFDMMFQTLFYEKHGRLPRVLWLTKKSLVKSSSREIKKWNPDRNIVPIMGSPEQRKFLVELAIQGNALVITNYEATGTTKQLRDVNWDLVIADEVQKLKGGITYNPKTGKGGTAIWHNVKAVAKKAEFFLPLSGSPIENKPEEMWAYLHIFDEIRFPDVKTFTQTFCDGWGEGKTIAWDKLVKVLSKQVIRRSKTDADVKLDLPDKVRQFVYLEMEGKQLEVYQELRDQMFVWLDDNKEDFLSTDSILAQLTRLRQVNLFPGSVKFTNSKTGATKTLECDESVKLDEAMDIIEQLTGAGEQVVVFSSQFNDPLFELERRIHSNLQGVTVEVIHGANSAKVDEYEQRFRDRKTNVLLCNAKTAGAGLNLQDSCNNAIFLDLWWNPKFNEQAEDRIWRIGQNKPVTIHILQNEDSVDAYIAAILERKEEMIEGIMETKEMRKGSDWAAYLKDLI